MYEQTMRIDYHAIVGLILIYGSVMMLIESLDNAQIYATVEVGGVYTALGFLLAIALAGAGFFLSVMYKSTEQSEQTVDYHKLAGVLLIWGAVDLLIKALEMFQTNSGSAAFYDSLGDITDFEVIWWPSVLTLFLALAVGGLGWFLLHMYNSKKIEPIT